MVRQAAGLKHCRNIKRAAKRLWKQSNYQQGLWDECLKSAIEHHRKRVARAIYLKMKREEKMRQTNDERQYGMFSAEGCC